LENFNLLFNLFIFYFIEENFTLFDDLSGGNKIDAYLIPGNCFWQSKLFSKYRHFTGKYWLKKYRKSCANLHADIKCISASFRVFFPGFPWFGFGKIAISNPGKSHRFGNSFPEFKRVIRLFNFSLLLVDFFECFKIEIGRV